MAQNDEKVPCSECGRLILRRMAELSGGRCSACKGVRNVFEARSFQGGEQTKPTSYQHPVEKQPPKPSTDATSFAGKAEIIWLVVLGVLSAAAFIAALTQGFSTVVVWATGALAAVFALPFALLLVAVVLAVIVQIFTPGGGSAIPILGWKGGVDGLSPDQRRAFEARPRAVRFGKVYVWLAVNSLVGAAITLAAFAALYALMQFAQQPNH